MNYTQTWRDRTDLSKNEYWKLEKDGLEILKELDRLSTTPFEQIDVSDIERLKWAGIYCQRPKNGKFLIRIKLPSGKLNAAQGHIIADLAEQYGQSELQITIRQCIQIHNLTLNEIPDIFRALDSVGLTTVEGCGDVPRNILGNPLMGVDPEELFDTEPIVDEAVRRFVGNPDYANLPRKYKLSFSANPHDVGYAGINDLAFVPAVYGPAHTPGFHLRIGGGLSSEPKLS
jgi:ferredoxin-nitrite reductase